MASKKTLSAETLEALGARRLAELLMDVAGQDAATAEPRAVPSHRIPL